LRLEELEGLVVVLQDPTNIDKVSKINITDLTKIDEDHLVIEYDLVSRMYAVIAMLAGYAQNKEARAKFLLEAEQAQLDTKVRYELKSSTEKVTESMIATKVRSSKEYQRRYSDWLEARKQHIILSKLESALQLKKDLLISLAADIRASNRS